MRQARAGPPLPFFRDAGLLLTWWPRSSQCPSGPPNWRGRAGSRAHPTRSSSSRRESGSDSCYSRSYSRLWETMHIWITLVNIFKNHEKNAAIAVTQNLRDAFSFDFLLHLTDTESASFLMKAFIEIEPEYNGHRYASSSPHWFLLFLVFFTIKIVAVELGRLNKQKIPKATRHNPHTMIPPS